jgi:hypothetical protein
MPFCKGACQGQAVKGHIQFHGGEDGTIVFQPFTLW